jgi:hypothetical protein
VGTEFGAYVQRGDAFAFAALVSAGEDVVVPERDVGL